MVKRLVVPFKLSAKFYIETSYLMWNLKTNDSFLYEMQHWPRMPYNIYFSVYFEVFKGLS